MRPDLVIFDCDGVLVDSEVIANGLLAEMLSAEGYPIDRPSAIARFMGRPTSESLREVEQELGRQLSPGFVERHERRVIEAFVADPRPVPGVRAAALALPGRRCVASSSGHDYLRAVLAAAGLADLFERLFSSREVAHGKPAPDLFLHAAASLGVPPASCVVIEDSPAGVEAAVAAGMPVLGYAAMLAPEVLAGCGAVPFTAMAELPATLARLEPA
ncbi:MAG: HAD-IA family hydrolase [Deinococcales bacterium]